MPGIIFTRYDRVPSGDEHAPRTRHPGAIDRRRFLGGVSALAASASMRLVHGGTAAARQTPGSTDGAVPVEALRALLQRVPASVATGDRGGWPFYHADLAAQFAATGVDRTAADWMATANLFSVTAPLALASAGFQYGTSDDFSAAFGFRPLDVDRVLEVGGAPNSLSIYQGGLDRAAMEAAWPKTGFKQVPLEDGFVLWTMGEQGAIDLSSPIAPYGAGAFNNLLLLDDQTLLVSRMGAVIRAVVSQAKAADAAGSMLGIAGVQQVLAACSPTVVSSIGLSGALLGAPAAPRPGAAATPAVPAPPAAGGMPGVRFALFAIEAGAQGQIARDGSTPAAGTPSATGGSQAKVEVRLATASRADAEEAARIAAMRWETMQSQVVRQPFSELMALVSSGVSETEETVAALDFESGPEPGRWIQLVAMQDLAPFSPGS